MQALNRLVNAGKVHYLGISDSPAWVAMKANLYAQQHGLAQFSVYQGLYNAAVRDCEREIMPVCEDTGMAFVAYGAQGGGEFRTKEQRDALKEKGEGRKMPASQGGAKYVSTTEVLDTIAKKKGVKITQLVSHFRYLPWLVTRLLITKGSCVDFPQNSLHLPSRGLSQARVPHGFDRGYDYPTFRRGSRPDLSRQQFRTRLPYILCLWALRPQF